MTVPPILLDMAENPNHPGWMWVCVGLAILSGIML